MDSPSQSQLFEQISFTIVPDDDRSDEQQQLLIDTLTSNGASYHECKGSVLPPLKSLTHIISDHVDFPEYLDVLNISIPVVKPTWVSDSITKGRLVTPRQYCPDPSQFFHDVIVSCGTLPESDENAIIAGVIALGGQYSDPLTKIVTHLVTTDLKNEKSAIITDRDLAIKMVLPHWFDDCLRLGKKIDEQPYQFPNPQILHKDLRDPIRVNPAPCLEGATSSTPNADLDSPMISPSKSRKSLNAFSKRCIYLGKDLELSPHLKYTLRSLITRSGGELVEILDSADIYIGYYRDSDEFVTAFDNGKIIANLAWLYHVLNTNRWSNPTSKLLHYPTPKHGIPGFEDLRISVSSFSGDARVYVQNLVRECGATFTKTMKQENTHLITAHKSSEKCIAAQEWNINVINHLWLEESYAQCAVQTLTNPRYTHFPSRTNLGEVCGQIGINVRRIEEVYVTPKLRKRRTPIARRLFEPKQALSTSTPLGTAYNELTNEQHTPSELLTTGNAAPPTHEEHDPVHNEANSDSEHTRKSFNGTPRTLLDEKENRSPAISGGRASKMKALGTIHRQADDIALFQKEMKRKGGVTHGGRPDEPRGKKRTSDATYEVTAMGSELSDGETQAEKPVKKSKKETTSDSILPPIHCRLMITGVNRWNGNANKESADKIKLRQLGVLLTDEPKEVDIVIAPKILRTRKFVVAVASAPRIVGNDYLDKALIDNTLVEEPPLLVDRESEKLYDFKLKEALDRAKVNRGQLFRGWELYVSDKLTGGFDTYNEIVQANGGSAVAFRNNRRGMTLKHRILDDPEAGEESQNQGDTSDIDQVYLVTGDSTAEKALWKNFKHIAIEQKLKPRIVKSDWLLTAALTQQIRHDPRWDWEVK